MNNLTPFRRFCNGLHHIRNEFNENLDEMLVLAEVMALKANSIEVDGDTYYVTATGPLEEVIPVLHAQLEKLERINRQKKEGFN